MPQDCEYRLQDVKSPLSDFYSSPQALPRVQYWALDGSMARTKAAQEEQLEIQ